MNKIILTLATLAAVSSSAFAFQNRSEDLRDVEAFKGGVSVINPLAAVDTSDAPRIDYRMGTQDQVNN